MVKMGGDEREKRWGYSGKWDERDRSYFRLKIDKRKLINEINSLCFTLY